MKNPENSLNLVPAIREIESQISKLECEFQRKMKPYYASLVRLREINTACEKCCGEGKVLRPRSCAEDDVDKNDPRDWIVCEVCKGSGLAPQAREQR